MNETFFSFTDKFVDPATIAELHADSFRMCPHSRHFLHCSRQPNITGVIETTEAMANFFGTNATWYVFSSAVQPLCMGLHVLLGPMWFLTVMKLLVVEVSHLRVIIILEESLLFRIVKKRKTGEARKVVPR